MFSLLGVKVIGVEVARWADGIRDDREAVGHHRWLHLGAGAAKGIIPCRGLRSGWLHSAIKSLLVNGGFACYSKSSRPEPTVPVSL